jgi:hypothetical protein
MDAARFFDQGEHLFEIVFLMLWLAFVLFLICCAVRFARLHERTAAKSRMNRRTNRSSKARGVP